MRRRRRCYLGPEEEVGQKPEEVRASPRLEAEEVLGEGEEEPRAARREIPMRKGRGSSPRPRPLSRGPRRMRTNSGNSSAGPAPGA
ncbi:MAG: hypothetical protein RXQ62_06030 [Nitrososphaeria archaeon]